jgi:hypothetical protein
MEQQVMLAAHRNKKRERGNLAALFCFRGSRSSPRSQISFRANSTRSCLAGTGDEIASASAFPSATWERGKHCHDVCKRIAGDYLLGKLNGRD